MNEGGHTTPRPAEGSAGGELGFDTKWLPSSPHCEVILEYLRDGRAHVVERGHCLAPWLVFEDGGQIELPRVRYEPTERGMQLVAGESADQPDQTRYRDVCGTIDAIKARISDSPQRALEDKADLVRLAREIAHMLGRLQSRREAYERFAEDLQRCCQAIAQAPRPDRTAGMARLRELIERLEQADLAALTQGRQGLFETAEAVRALAQGQEDFLRDAQAQAIEVARLYRRIKGGRNWPE